MSLVYSEGALEAEEIRESVIEAANTLNEAGRKSQMFAVFTDFAGQPLVLNLTLVTKIKESD